MARARCNLEGMTNATATLTRSERTAATTVAQLRATPTCEVWHTERPNAAGALGIGRRLAYAMASDGRLPTIRLGRRLVVPTAKLLILLGVEDA